MRRIFLSSGAALGHRGGSAGDEQRTVRAFERRAERFDGALVDLAASREVRPVVPEGGVDHAVGLGRSAAQGFEVFEIPSKHLGACGDESFGALLGAGHAEHLMARVNKLWNKSRTDKTCSTGDENTHCDSPWLHCTTAFRSPVSYKMEEEQIRSISRVRIIFAIVQNDDRSFKMVYESPIDPLSDVLSLLKPRSYMAGGFDVGGELSIRFGQHDGIKCYAVVSGQCWLSVEGVPDAVRLEAGDCLLLPHGRPFRLATNLSLEPVDALPLLKTARRQGAIALINGGGRCCIVGGFFSFSGNHASILLGVLPPIVHLQKESDKAEMRWYLERMRQELLEQQPGGSLVAQHLAHMMLVQALRLHLTDGVRGGVGWLFALADKQMSAAITAMHDSPGHRWTLQELGERAGMSRSIFAQKFKSTVGTSPLEYLTRWRMMLAGDKLTNSSDPVSVIAQSLSYESESAFSTAFKRVMGCSPRQYSRGRNPASPSHRAEEAARADLLEPVAG